MRVSFSMDGIKSIDVLYTYTSESYPGFDNVLKEHYHGDEYCKRIMDDVFSSLNPGEWGSEAYYEASLCKSTEIFKLLSNDGTEYTIIFDISTYSGEAARLEVTVISPELEDYDHRLEGLKITLKNRLILDWNQCTWLSDEQAASLSISAYEKAFAIENNLRAFASKVLIHFLGVGWINKSGLEKQARSVDILKEKFISRVPEFDNINTDFLSMTLETLVGVIFEGVIYQDDIILSRQDYETLQNICTKQNTPGSQIIDYIKKNRTVNKRVWEDLFAPYIDDQIAFKSAVHKFIEDRNHVAHSKVLSWNSYQVIVQDCDEIRRCILLADLKFDQEETSDEVLNSWQAEQMYDEYERKYFRNRLAGETGMDILDEPEIEDWFDEVLYELFGIIYQRYHFDVCYEVSDFSTPKDNNVVFTILSKAIDDGSAKISVVAEYSIDDELGASSVCQIICKDADNKEICKAEVRYHNGNGHEGEEGLMEAFDSSEYDTSELDGFQSILFTAIENVNPYPEKLHALSYETKGAIQFVAEIPCENCGKHGISINDNFLTIGRCCYCGYINELAKCKICGEIVNFDLVEQGVCSSCAAHMVD